MKDRVHHLEVTETFEVFYRRAWSVVYRAVAVAIDDSDLARESTDEAMTRAYERWSTVNGMENREGWVYRVAVNWARSRIRRRRLAITKVVESPLEYEHHLPEPELHRAILSLPPHQRDVLVARFMLDMSEEETSKAFGIPKGTVKSRLNRAMTTLREELA